MKLPRKVCFTQLFTSDGAHHKTLMRGSVLVPAVALLATIVASPVTANAASAAASDRDCTIQSYSTGGDEWLPFVTWKGKDTPKYNNGETNFRGRTLRLLTSHTLDRSAGQILHSHSNDRVWVDITGTQGNTWQQCGTKANWDGIPNPNLPDTFETTTPWFQHGTVKDRWIRACMEVDGFTLCATNGNHTGPGGRKWWSDKKGTV
jgi:hypothetical protein